ncbi:MAG: radical SAM protein [Oscillospiraceae bacterium]
MICNLCPRRCAAVRENDKCGGACQSESAARVARAAVHRGEEPCISGTEGSGTVFFSGCPLGCVFCQNSEISLGHFGKSVSDKRLSEIFKELCALGVHNINLVTPTHFTDAIINALELYSPPVPVVWNSSGYELAESLRRLEGKVSIFMPDMKYSDNRLASRYSNAKDYFEVAKEAILEMFRQVGAYKLDENGILQSGVIIRHLVLPENLENTFGVIDWVRDYFDDGDILFSLMAQYTPAGKLDGFPELKRPINAIEYEQVSRYLFDSGIEDGYIQDSDAAGEDFIPDFDLSGV